jgi:D,D-heptose 1,7-bisphosphate phosphatase
MNTLPKAVFLDKDGTLVEDVPYNVDPEKIRLVPEAVESLRALKAAGFKLIVISNQAGVAHGRFKEEALKGVEKRLNELLGEHGVALDGFYFCPHHPDGRVRVYTKTCFCRKPSPGMLFQAARDHGLNLADSWFIGDILNDVEAGRRADCRTILIDNGNETEWDLSPLRRPHYTVKTLAEAAQVILPVERGALPKREAPIPVKRDLNISLNA